MPRRISFCFLVFIFLSLQIFAQEKNTIYLTWDQVVDFSLRENLNLRSKQMDYKIQDLEVWKSLSAFLPTFSYTGIATRNLELPVLFFQGQKFVVGTNYTFQHSLTLTMPLFTGGSRWFNFNAQKSLRRSLAEELKGTEEGTVQNALKAYFGIILSEELYKTAKEAVSVAEENLAQVEKFYEAGTATELDLQRAKAQYSSTLPRLESAASGKELSYQRLKSFLNIPLSDSLVILDTLETKDFLNDLNITVIESLKKISAENRKDLKSLFFQFEAVEEGENLALSQFAPTVALSASVDHQAPLDNSKVQWNDYIRAKSLTLSLSWPLFEGGRRILDYQIAKIKTDQMNLFVEQAKDQADLDVEQSYYNYVEADKNRESLKQSMIQAKESLRISNLLYNEGMTTQLDVLNSQLLYNNSKVQYLQGIYDYNISQLDLLKSIGMIDKIWN